MPVAPDRRVVRLPAPLAESAVDLAALGVEELAFPRPVLLELLNFVLHERLRVLGGDVWREESLGSGLRPTYLNWFTEGIVSPTETYELARRFVEDSTHDGDYVVLVLESADLAVR